MNSFYRRNLEYVFVSADGTNRWGFCVSGGKVALEDTRVLRAGSDWAHCLVPSIVQRCSAELCGRMVVCDGAQYYIQSHHNHRRPVVHIQQDEGIGLDRRVALHVSRPQEVVACGRHCQTKKLCEMLRFDNIARCNTIFMILMPIYSYYIKCKSK